MSEKIVRNETDIEEKPMNQDPNDEAFMRKMKILLLLLKVIFGIAFFISIGVIFVLIAK